MSTVTQLPRPPGAAAEPARRPGSPRPAPAARPGPLGVVVRVASYLSSTWLLAAAGLIILAISLALMAHSAPGQRPAPASSPHSARHQPGPVPGHYRGSELRAASRVAPAR